MRWHSCLVCLIPSAVLALAPRLAFAACGTYPLPVTGAHIQQFSSIDAYVQSWVQANNVNAATLALVYDKKLVYERGFGYQDPGCTRQILPDAVMRLATNSTAMTRRALQQLIADKKLTATTNVWQYLNGNFTFPAGPDAREQQIRVQDIYDFQTCTSDDNYLDNVSVGLNMNLGRPATASERIQYLWSHPQNLMTALACTPGQATNNGFSHVSHEIAAMIIATAAFRDAFPSNVSKDPSALTSATGIGTWYGNYIVKVGNRVGAAFAQAGDIYAGSPGAARVNEIWYDSVGATQCPEWNYWACNFSNPRRQAPVPAAYAIDFFARPGSGTVTSSARDVARFMVSYEWATDNSPLTNSIAQLSNRPNLPGKPWGCCAGGSLSGTTTLMGDGQTKLNNQFHFWNWVLLTNRNNVDSSFNIGGLLDNGNNGVFNTFVPTVDLYQDNVLWNRWIQQDATVDLNTNQVRYSPAGTFKTQNPYFPFSTLPDARYLWRVMPDANGFYTFTNEASTGVMLSNEHNLANAELLTPNNSAWSEEWSLVPAPAPDQSYTQIMARWWSGHGLNVQGQTGQVEQSTIQASWWSADWLLQPQPSGLCCTNLTSNLSCPAKSSACNCGDPGCPAYTN